MQYTIEIKGMEFRAPHGCYDTEQQVGGNFTVDVTLTVDGEAESDDMSRTVNYVEVYKLVRREMTIPSRIIENAALRIITAIRTRFGPGPVHSGQASSGSVSGPAAGQILRIEVTVSKLAPPLGGKSEKVSVTLVG